MKLSTLLSALALSALVVSCGTVPITGRRSLNLVSDGEVLAMSRTQYSSFVSQARSQGALVQHARVNEVARRLISATDAYLKQNNLTDLISTLQWEVNTVNSDQVNAFCMPGGKIVVYTGILTLIGNTAGSDAELAAVLAHEIAHALARHSSERLSNTMLQNMGGQVLGQVIGQKSQTLGAVFEQVYGLGTNVFVALPFGRKQEYEADQMGLVLMALAGYDPSSAVTLWQKMARASGGNQNEFLSTHPSEENRIKRIQEYLPTARQYYKPVTTSATTPTPQRKTTTWKR